MKRSRRSNERKPVAWQRIRENLDNLRDAVERGWQPAPEERQRILETRAKRLAEPPTDAAAAEERIELVEFALAHERYAVVSSFVREVFPLVDLTRLPGTPPFVQGIVNLRGEIVSVIDLKKFFDLPDKGLTDLNRVIVLDTEAMTLGVLADSLLGVRQLPTRELQHSLPTLTGIREDYLLGITNEHVVVLDAEKFLTDRRIVVNEQVET